MTKRHILRILILLLLIAALFLQGCEPPPPPVVDLPAEEDPPDPEDEPPPPPPAQDPADVIRQVVQAARLSNDNGMMRLEVSLNPESLGKMQIILTAAANGGITAELRFENDSTRALLSNGLNELGGALRGQGLDISRIEIEDGRLRQDFTRDESRRNQQNGQQQKDERVPMAAFLNGKKDNGDKAIETIVAAIIPAAPRPVIMGDGGSVEYVT